MAVDKMMNVLIVDEYKTMLRITHNILKQLGFMNIDEATDTQTALGLIQQKQYGLIISDFNMSPLTGLDLLKEVRANENNASTPFIILSAETKAEQVLEAKNAGVNNYIVKPFNAETFKSKLTSVLGQFS